MRDRRRTRTRFTQAGTVAYVLKSFPRLSETFITSEIYRLEQRQVALRLFVIKRSDEAVEHALVRAIGAPRTYLPDARPISAMPAMRWLKYHAARFVPSLVGQTARHPWRVARAAGVALAYALRARERSWAWPRKSALKNFLQAAALADALERAGDVMHVHAHFCHSATTVAWLATIMTGLPLSFTAHAKDIYSADQNPGGLLERKLAAAKFVVTCTETNRAYLQARTSTPVHCLYHGLDVEFARLCGVSPARQPSGATIRALAVGRLVRKKGFDVFLEACAILRARGCHVEATIAGESGDHEAELRARVAALALEPLVRFTGALGQPQLIDEYRRATVFCLPCRVLPGGDRDGIPNVIAEAMACGVPVVTTGASAIPELLDDGVHGILVPPDDPVAVADAIQRLHARPALAETIATRARARIIESFNGDRSAKVLSRLLAGGAA